ncbi:MAG: DNA polymerase III subunit gamma/tau [Gammaproteobacteria bacterium SG8_47]|nr:MAG: DNA polymerase III subunit gamma/tau [Gammaproteobacteria bacterium SG8_47]
MSYQVLARKWRPRNFAELVGQEHVQRALINALDNDRLHHAFLFTGTRGVGKTTIARILAKSINCEQGVSSKPCGTCSACREIDEGRFVDLIEVDAASRTKVEDTRDLLDNVQYAPTRGRYKVYLIDEVHMLSAHSFNALLKTLEEPPPHVKFLLATTDPQKLPVTILSRCLQFHLRRLHPDQIRGHLSHITAEEGVETEPAALAQLARAADGSMRDALSLLDQAIAFGGGRVAEDEVKTMLGTIEQRHVFELLAALGQRDGGRLLAELAAALDVAPDPESVLSELMSTLHHLAVLQVVPQGYDEAMGPEAELLQLSTQLTPQDVQLFYQIGLLGRRDLTLAPDPRAGLQMILLRMLAFRPAETVAEPAPAQPAPSGRKQARVAAALAHEGQTAPAVERSEPVTSPGSATQAAVLDWHRTVASLKLAGVVKQLAIHCALVAHDGERLELCLDPDFSHLHTKDRQTRLEQALSEHLAQPVRLNIAVQSPPDETPAARAQRVEAERLAAATQRIEQDANVKAIVDTFNARIRPDSIQPQD